jgi:hypothetical protein
VSVDERVLLDRILLAELEEAEERDFCAEHPAHLMARMSAPDERTAEKFAFPTDDPASGWYWQREILDWWLRENRCIALKARQLGVTWLGCGYVLWTALYKPGSLCLVYRQKEEEAIENIRRAWDLLHSLQQHLWNGAEVITPTKGARPNQSGISLRFPDGRISRIVPMTSASASGHGKTAAVVLLDEFSRIDRASEIMKAVQPAAGAKGKILIISTANGVSNPETGDGNDFHRLWVNADDAGFTKRFLPWSLHPDRDQRWYDFDPEVRGLKSHERAEQYPANEHEAFTLTNRVFFEPEDLMEYADRVESPLYRMDFERIDPQHARPRKGERGMISVYREPEAGHGYAIGADVATGRGLDYSAAYVVDLASMELVAEFHGRLDQDLYAYQLHYLGRWYNTALVAHEVAGGYGEAVTISLRDGREGRPPYPKMYRHIMSSRPSLDVSKALGFPTNSKTRPQIINGLDKAIRERSLPYVTAGLLTEMQTFVYHDTGPSPAAQSGSRDDRVMACAIALEMYRLHGSHPDRRAVKHTRKPKRHWLRAA